MFFSFSCSTYASLSALSKIKGRALDADERGYSLSKSSLSVFTGFDPRREKGLPEKRSIVIWLHQQQ
jgi:hypothetical protein